MQKVSGLALESCQCYKTNTPQILQGWLVEWLNLVMQTGPASWFWRCLKSFDEFERNPLVSSTAEMQPDLL